MKCYDFHGLTVNDVILQVHYSHFGSCIRCITKYVIHSGSIINVYNDPANVYNDPAMPTADRYDEDVFSSRVIPR